MIREDFADLFSLLKSMPNNWAILKMKHIVSTKITDGPHETPELIDEGIPFISAEAIKNDRINFDLKRGCISEEFHKEYSKKCKPQRNDIFIIKSGATTGNVAYVDVDVEFNIWSPLAVVRCDEKIAHYKFIYYQLLSDIFRKQVELSWSFGTQENIGMGVIERLNVIIPGIVEQNLISTYLDNQCTAIDKVIEIKKEQLTILDELHKSTIHKAVTKGLNDNVEFVDSGIEWIGKIPKGWEIDRVKDVVFLRNTKSDDKDDVENYIELEDIEQKTGRLIAKRNTLGVESAVTLFQKGDILFGKLRPYLEKYYFADFDGRCTGEILVFKPENVDGKYFFYCVASPWFIKRCDVLSYGTKMPRVNWPTQIAVIDIPIPPREEQKRIADYLDRKWEAMRGLQKNLNNQIDVLENYRKSLIHECITGKRRIIKDDLKELANVSGS